MPRIKYRTRLTNDEWNTIAKLTRRTKLDSVFDIYSNGTGKDYFFDFEENKKMSLKAGFELLYESLAYPLSHEGLTENESKLIVNLFKEFNVAGNEADWLLKKDNFPEMHEWINENEEREI